MTTKRLLALSDISLLARVRRPVVTTWRARYASKANPFPAPADTVGGQEFFDAEQVVRWIEATGCGNNREVRQDAIAFTLTAADVSADSVNFEGLTALICLRAATGPLSTDLDEVLDTAESFDSDDDILFSEIERLGSQLGSLARYAELWVASALDPADPLDDLIRRQRAATSYQPVQPELRRLVARTAVALADEAGLDAPTYVVHRVEDLDLVVAQSSQIERRGSLRVALALTRAQWDSSGARLARRWVYVHGATLQEILVDADGAYELPKQAVFVLRLPTTVDDREAALEEVSNLCLNLPADARAVIVGPAHSLTDALVEERRPGRPSADATRLSSAGLNRSDALRSESARAVVRLPAGLLTEQSRSRAALWCLGPSRSVPSATLCADLTVRLDEASTDDLVTDLMAAMRGPASEVAHHLGSAGFQPTSDLSLSVHDLVTPIMRELHLGPAAVATNLLDVLSLNAAELPGLPPFPLTFSTDGSTLERMSLGKAVRQRKIVLLPGARVDSAATSSSGGGAPIVRHPADLGRRAELSTLNTVTLSISYPQISLTEPGDIVVASSGGPEAVVDTVGGSIVAYPARVLRCHRPLNSTPDEEQARRARGEYPHEYSPQTFTPESVAADINALPPAATTWKAWPLTVLPSEQIASLERVLTGLAERRARLDAARADIDTTIRALTQAVGAQICTVGRTGQTHTDERTTA